MFRGEREREKARKGARRSWVASPAFARRGSMARGRGYKHAAESSATALQAQAQKMIKGTQSDDTEELMNLLQGRAEVVSHVLKLLKKGALTPLPSRTSPCLCHAATSLLLNKDQYILPILCKLLHRQIRISTKQ